MDYRQLELHESALDDYGSKYSTSSVPVEGASDELHDWIKINSSYDDYLDYGEYGSRIIGWLECRNRQQY